MASLVIKNDGIGDLVLSSGLIADLARERGPLDLVTCAANREVAENIPGLRRLFLLSRDGLRYRDWGLRVGLRLRQMQPGDREVLESIGRETYDTAVCLRRFIRQSSLIVMRTVRAQRRCCAWLYPTDATPALAEAHSLGWEHYRGGELGSELTYFRTFVESTLGVRSASPPTLRCAMGRTPRPVGGEIGLVISGGSTNWPEARWIELAAGLGRQGMRLTILGGPDSRELASRMSAVAPGARDLTARLTFEQSVDVLLGLELVIGNDTGLTHFASLCSHRVLVILGGGTFGRFFPWPDSANQFVLFKGMECFDCDWQCRYESRRCLGEIGAEDVLRFAADIRAGSAEGMRNVASESCLYQPGWRRGGKAVPVELVKTSGGIPGVSSGKPVGNE